MRRIGAAVGAGAGAGSVYVQGRDDLELARETELTILASAPLSSHVPLLSGRERLGGSNGRPTLLGTTAPQPDENSVKRFVLW